MVLNECGEEEENEEEEEEPGGGARAELTPLCVFVWEKVTLATKCNLCSVRFSDHPREHSIVEETSVEVIV